MNAGCSCTLSKSVNAPEVKSHSTNNLSVLGTCDVAASYRSCHERDVSEAQPVVWLCAGRVLRWRLLERKRATF